MRSSGFHMSAIGLALLLASSGRAVAGQADSASDDELRAMKDRFAAAAKEIVRLGPSSFPQLPRPISDWMTAGGYTVPQSFCDSSIPWRGLRR